MTTIAAAASNQAWETAGPRKATKKLSPNGETTKKVNGGTNTRSMSNKETIAKMPKVENMAPLKINNTIYDHLQDSDDEIVGGSMSFVKNKMDNRVPSLIMNQAPTSPKPVKPAKQIETVNLLAASIATSKKKPVGSPSAGKNINAEFEKALSQLKIEDFEKELSNVSVIFPNNQLMLNQQMTTFLNFKLIQVADIEPAATHENEIVFPTSKLDKKLVKFYNGILTKLTKSDSEVLFDACFESLFLEKSTSNHGYRIVSQLLAKHLPSLLNSNNLTKYYNTILANKHKPQRCLLAMWSLGQFGYYNLTAGVRVWYECMLPFVTLKNAPNFIVTYLNAIFQYHGIDTKSVDKLPANLITIDQYLQFFEFLNEKLPLTRDSLQKLKLSFETIRAWFLRDLSQRGAEYFEPLFAVLPLENSPKQVEFLDLLEQIIISNEQALFKWRRMFSRHIQQTLILVERVSQVRNVAKNKNLRQTLSFIEEQTAALLSKQAPAVTKEQSINKNYFKKSATAIAKANEAESLRKLNELTKKLMNKKSSGGKSWFGMTVKTLFYIIILTGCFFYWDANQNKSVYTKVVRKELARHNLLKPVDNILDSAKTFLLKIQNLIYTHVPIYYKTVNDAVEPAFRNAYQVTINFVTIAWVKSEPYRDAAVYYVNEAIGYVHTNFPDFVKNLTSIVELVVNYFTTLTNFFLHYASQFLDFVGIKLLGMRNGEFEKVFLDGFTRASQYLTNFYHQLVKSLSQM